MDICPSIRTTDALGRYVLRHRVHASREMIVAHPQALSVRQRLFSSVRACGDVIRLDPEAIRDVMKGGSLCARSY
ncbi:hypothetical protein [Microbacterium karelineae]|uniref:hypothetical protein n=1 Tax=Microbacterium karelineae TaxID=2654283 RepID=UPI0012EA6DC9|nr:hypothetical protein [Microbacterium karelineae]